MPMSTASSSGKPALTAWTPIWPEVPSATVPSFSTCTVVLPYGAVEFQPVSISARPRITGALALPDPAAMPSQLPLALPELTPMLTPLILVIEPGWSMLLFAVEKIVPRQEP